MNNINGFKEFIASLPDGEVEISIRKNKPDRSQMQNRYYWGVVVDLISDYTGFEKDEVHEILKWKFLREVRQFEDKVYEFSRSTTGLTTAEFEDYLEQCRRWANTELEVLIPLPNEAEVGNGY